jgi:hypothetical protein
MQQDISRGTILTAYAGHGVRSIDGSPEAIHTQRAGFIFSWAIFFLTPNTLPVLHRCIIFLAPLHAIITLQLDGHLILQRWIAAIQLRYQCFD